MCVESCVRYTVDPKLSSSTTRPRLNQDIVYYTLCRPLHRPLFIRDGECRPRVCSVHQQCVFMTEVPRGDQ